MTLFFLRYGSFALAFALLYLLTSKHFVSDEGLHFAVAIREFPT